jgi:hypothetical protein
MIKYTCLNILEIFHPANYTNTCPYAYPSPYPQLSGPFNSSYHYRTDIPESISAPLPDRQFFTAFLSEASSAACVDALAVPSPPVGPAETSYIGRQGSFHLGSWLAFASIGIQPALILLGKISTPKTIQNDRRFCTHSKPKYPI